jgi:hypothetical protein
MAIPHRFSSDYARKKPSTNNVAQMAIKFEPKALGTVASHVTARFNVERTKGHWAWTLTGVCDNS